MTSVEKKISFLISRLNWPSGFVREKTCDSIAYLLLNPHYSETVKKELLSWLSNQKLESMVIVGLLAFVKAMIIDDDLYLDVDEINHTIKKPSILSWILLNYMDKTYSFPDCRKLNSGDPPADFKVNYIFEKYKKSLIPPFYAECLELIENTSFYPLTEQWAYEWQNILEEMDIIPSKFKNKVYNLPYHHREYLGCDYELSEIYRSAFLRSVSFGYLTDLLSKNDAILLSIKTCPADLGIWKSKTHVKPDFWPKINKKIDIEKDLWEKISSLKKQNEIQSDWIISEASGRLFEENSVYDLKIMGIFEIGEDCQDEAVFEIISNQYEANRIQYKPKNKNYPILEGSAEFNSQITLRNYTGCILPASGYIKPLGIPKWQYFKVRRNIWIPMPFILSKDLKLDFDINKTTISGSDSKLRFNFSEKGLIIKHRDTTFAKWMDWADSLTEKTNVSLPPSNGQYLLIKKKTINEFLLETNLKFSWLCELTKYEKKGVVDIEYKSTNKYQKLNVSLNQCN